MHGNHKMAYSVKAKPSNPRNTWKYTLADFDKVNELLSQMDMASNLDETEDVQVAWAKFEDAILEKMEKCITKGKIPKRKNLPWLTKDLTKMMKKRNRHFNHARSSTKYTAEKPGGHKT